MQVFYDKDANKYLLNSPGITLEAAKWLIDDRQAMALGADNIGLEAISALTQDNWVPVHTYLEAERGVTIIEVLDLEALSRDKVYEFVFIGAPLKLRGATGAPMRPLAIPVR
jgi:kynurenine formamidase